MHLYVYCIDFFGWEIQTLSYGILFVDRMQVIYVSKTNIFSSSWITQYSINIWKFV